MDSPEHTEAILEHKGGKRGVSVPAPLPISDRPRLTTPKTWSVIRRQISKDPKPTARDFQEKNLRLLGNVSLWSVQHIQTQQQTGIRTFPAYCSFKPAKKSMLLQQLELCCSC